MTTDDVQTDGNPLPRIASWSIEGWRANDSSVESGQFETKLAGLTASMFDAEWYMEFNPDVRAANVVPLDHFIRFGLHEGRDPHPLFSSRWYLDVNQDARESGVPAFEHYVRYGMAEGRDPHPLFDTRYYVERYHPPIGVPPFATYVQHGESVGHVPNAAFDAEWYLERNPDVRVANVSPFRHFIIHGLLEGRDPHPLFSSSWYLEINQDVSEKGIPAFEHFIRHGMAEGRDPHPLFDTRYYGERYPPTLDLPPFLAYLQYGEALGHVPTALFDAEWYMERNPELRATKVRPFKHFLLFGLSEGRDPHPLFSSHWYLDVNQDVRESGIPAFEHYVRCGASEGRDPHPLFDTRYYVERYHPPLDVPPFVAYVQHGESVGHVPTALFDTEWYLERNPEVRVANVTPFRHFLLFGLLEERDPHPLFSNRWYLEINQDVREKGLPAFEHFVRYGMSERRDPHPLFETRYYDEHYRPPLDQLPFVSFVRYGEAAGHVPTPLFDPQYYLERHPDVVASRSVPFAHFIRKGLYADYSPLRLFDNGWYKTVNTDVGDAITAVQHYLFFGIREERDPHPLFRSRWYREQYAPELRAGSAFRHYLDNGHLKPNSLFDPLYVDKQIRAAIESRLPSIFPSPPKPRNMAKASTIVFTSIASNYLLFASVLAESLKRHNPAVHFVIVLCDEPGEQLNYTSSAIDEIIAVRSLLGNGFSTWAFQHDIIELCTAAKGFALEHFLARPGCERVIYLDPDVFVTDRLAALDAALNVHSILVTPHLLAPEKEVDAIEQNEFDALRHGAFNLGFLAVRNDAAGLRFSVWWRDRLSRYCHNRRESGLFVDQKWMDLAPAFFPELGILRHVGYNAAPWNLSRRKIEGNPYDGFTVNGEPLAFFHFSGHKSGAGDGMLSRYANDMPAAALLASFYRHQLAVMSVDIPIARDWSYANYDNGVKISSAERHLYRERKDLQARFPDPFLTVLGESYLHWFRRTGDRDSNVAHGHIGLRDDGATMLDRYLAFAKTQPIRPNPLFDPEFYSGAYVDVFESGMDPLAHFLDYGLAEQRQACAEFDIAFYAKQVGSRNAEECFREVLYRGINPQKRAVASFVAHLDLPVLERMAEAMSDGLPRILMVSHDWGGGTTKHVRELRALLRGKAHVVCLMYRSGNFATLTTMSKSAESLQFLISTLGTAAVEPLRTLKFDRVHVHHAVGMDVELVKLLDALGCRWDVTLHDTFFLTPNPMFRHSSELRSAAGIDQAMAAAMNFPMGRALPPGMDLISWREALLPILQGADRLIAPTHFVADIYRRVHPSLHPMVIAHHEIARPDLPLEAPVLAAEERMNIAVIGGPEDHKGMDMLARCCDSARRYNLPLRFMAIGAGSETLLKAGVLVTGAYDDRDLPGMLAIYGVHATWFPYTAPESYCYALTVALWSGCQVVTTDVGCFPERTSGVVQATILPVETDEEIWLKTFQSLRARMIAGKVKALPIVPQNGDFYPDGYIEVFNSFKEAPTSVDLETYV